MDIVELIKDTAQQIIGIASDKNSGSKTWDEQPSAPEGGFTDRAGFVMINEAVESYADVALTEGVDGMLRARIAKTTGKGSEERFFIITLDFSTDTDSVKKIIEDRVNISAAKLVNLLNQEHTILKLIHISHNTGRGSNDKPTGTRYEFTKDQLATLSGPGIEDLSKTLNSTFNSITL